MSSIASAFDFTLTVDEKISKTKIKLKRTSPFFSYLLEYLRTEPSDRVPTIGVSQKGHCLYNEKFIGSLPDDHLAGVLIHEVMHCAMRDFSRRGERNATVNGMSIWNLAFDAQINQVIIENGFKIPEDGIIPVDNVLTLGSIVIENVSDKSSEELYEEILAQLRKQESEGKAKSGNDNDFTSPDDIPNGFDEHLRDDSDSDDDSNESGDETQVNSKPIEADVNWSEALGKAHAFAKLQGREPAGFERMFADLHKPKVNWRAILRRTVANSIPEEFTWKRPNKKYMAHDIYLPSTYGESIKVVCAIDTSGSIDHATLTDFISEIVGISRAYHEAEFIILSHDVNVHDEIPIRNGYQDKLSKLELHGGGGTSHIPMFEHVEQHKSTWDLETTVVISFTDGYSNFPAQRPKVDQVVFVLAGGHCPKEHLPDWSDTILTIE